MIKVYGTIDEITLQEFYDEMIPYIKENYVSFSVILDASEWGIQNLQVLKKVREKELEMTDYGRKDIHVILPEGELHKFIALQMSTNVILDENTVQALKSLDLEEVAVQDIMIMGIPSFIPSTD